MRQVKVYFLLLFSTLYMNAAELHRTGWNLMGVCQDMNVTNLNMTGITEVQAQDGKTIYVGDFSDYSNLTALEAGYAYWVKGDIGTTFNSGSVSNNEALVKPLQRTGWNLMASCDDVNRSDINMSSISELQAQDGESIYTGSNAQYSNLDQLLNGYGYWFKGSQGVLFTSKSTLAVDTIIKLDNDNDNIPDIEDRDDDNDGVLDNEDYRPLDSMIQTNPIYTQKINAYEQTYISRANPNSNYSDKSTLDLRDITSNQTFLTVLYFDIDSSYGIKEVDEIVETNLTVKSDTEEESVRVYLGNKSWSDANTLTWNLADGSGYLAGLTTEDSIASIGMSSGKASTGILGNNLGNGKHIFLLDEDGNSRGRLIKDNSEIYLDIAFKEHETQKVTVSSVDDTLATTEGGALQYRVNLASAPIDTVRVYFTLQDNSTAELSQAYLEFNSTNYSVPQVISIIGLANERGNSENQLLIQPLNSEDSNFNGHNPTDIDFGVYAVLPKAQSGYAYAYTVSHTLTNGAFNLIDEPVGMSINEKSAVIRWQPDVLEVGIYEFNITAVDESDQILFNKKVYLEVENNASNPVDAYYVVPNGTIANPTGSLGSISNPFTSIEDALLEANQTRIQTIYVRGGRYQFTSTINVEGIQGSKLKPITITRLLGEQVKLIIHGTYGFKIDENSKYLTFDGFELDGESIFEHNSVLENLWWSPSGDAQMLGGIAFHVDGHYISIRNNVIHDFFQKGVNIYYGRYVNVLDNIVYNIGHTSLSGGHGIMRKWDMDFFYTDTDGCKDKKKRCNDASDIKDTYHNDYGYPWRYDFSGNLVFAVEQRIYSRVWAKGYANFTIDEGKAIVTDESNDYYSNSNPRFRISHNLVIYNGVDHIRLKKYHNMQVNNNAVHSDLNRVNPSPDGISDASALPNLKFFGNLVTTASGSFAVDVKDSFTDENGDDTDVNENRKYDNYVSGGGSVMKSLAGITDMNGTDGSQLFANVAENNFSTVVEGSTIDVGVSDFNLTHIFDLANTYAVDVKSSAWLHDHVNMTDTIIKNIPDDVFDRTRYYRGASTVEEGHEALYIKIKDSDGQWLYNKLGEIDVDAGDNGVDWSNVNRAITEDYNFDYVDVGKCAGCRGAYVYQLIPKASWFEHYGSEDFNITNSDGTTTEIVYLDTNSSTNPDTYQEHRAILQYTAEGKNQLQGDI